MFTIGMTDCFQGCLENRFYCIVSFRVGHILVADPFCCEEVVMVITSW